MLTQKSIEKKSSGGRIVRLGLALKTLHVTEFTATPSNADEEAESPERTESTQAPLQRSSEAA